MPTFQTCRASSNIDLTIANYNMIPYVSDWTISDLESASDHNFIMFNINLNNLNTDNVTANVYKYKTNKADWPKFYSTLFKCLEQTFQLHISSSSDDDFLALDEMISSKINNSVNLNDVVVKFMEVLQQVCNQSLLKVKTNKTGHKSVPWWTEDLTKMRKSVNQLRRRYQRTKNDDLLRMQRKCEYYTLQKEYKNLLVSTKISSWKNFCNATNKSQPWNYIYKAAAGKLKNHTTFTSLKQSDGSYTNSLKDTLNALLDKYVPFDDPNLDNNHNKAIRQMSVHNIPSSHNDFPFSFDEIKNTIESFDPKKSPGEDGFNQEIVNHVFTKLPHSVNTIYNECLKRGIFPDLWKRAVIISIIKPGKENSDSVDKYRPISLLSIWGKVLEKLLINRIMHYLNKNNFLSTKQFGFTHQKNTLDAIMEVTEFIEKSLSSKEIVLLMSLDVKGAFDAAWWPSILVQLQKFNCPKNLYLLSLDYFKNREAAIKTNTLIINRKVTQGCPQGSCWGPGFWIIQYDSLLKENFPINSLAVAFADDLLIAVRGKSALEVECMGNSCMRIVEKWSQNNKVIFNSNKSNILIISNKTNISPVSVFLDNKVLQVVEELKYLGVVFDKHFSWNSHIRYITEKCFQLVNILSRSAKVYWGVGCDALRIIYDGALIPLITYALPAWHKGLTKKSNINKIRRLQRLFLLRLIKGFRTISYEAACVIADVIPIEIKIIEFHKKFRIMKGYDEDAIPVETPVIPSKWIHPALVPPVNLLERFQAENFNNSLVVYTDGSKTEGNVGSGFVVFINEQEVISKKYRLDERCSNNQAELLAISNALEYLTVSNEFENLNLSNNIVIRSDSQVSLQSISNYNNHLTLVERIRSFLLILHERGKTLYFNKVKAHIGESGNERADTLAKEAAEDHNIPISFTLTPRTWVEHKIYQESLASWELQWATTVKGAQTKIFFPIIEDRKSAMFQIGFKLTQVLSGHGRCREYLHRFHILPSPVCSCDNTSLQNWHHALFECSIFERQRAPFLRECVLRGIEWPPPGRQLLQRDLCHLFVNFVNALDFNELL